MDKKKVVAAVGDEEALFLIGNHTNHESDEMETDETRIETQNNDTVTCKSDDRDDENVVFSKESSPLVSKSTLLSTDSGAIKFEKCSQEKKLSRQDRIELGRLFQGAVSSHDWELAESLISLADPQTLNDALCISLDSIWFLSTHHELDGITALIKTIISNGASDFTRAALRTSFLASCVSACQSRTMSLADTVSVMAKRLHERLQECNGDEVLKAEAGAKVQKFTEWALKCIGFHSRCQGNKDRVNQNSAAQVQLQLSAFKTFLDLAGNHLTGKDFTEAFDAACFPLTLFSSSFDPGWASGMSATAIQGLLAMLVEGGADNVNQCFLEASRFGSTELVRILLQIAQRNSLDVDVDLALGFASHYSKISTMECLVEEGNAMAFLGPLMRAAERGCMQVVQWFVKRGCRDMELCLALTAATSSSQVDIAAYLLPHVPQHVLAALSIEILKAAGERSGGSLEGVAFLLQSNFLGDPAATYAVADSISRSDDDSVAPELREFLQEEWSEAAFFAGVSSGEVHYFNFVSISKWGESPISLMDLPGPLRVAIAYLPLYRECVKAGGCLLSQQLRGRLVEDDKKQISEHALTLKQIENGVIVPPSGWKCAKCDKTENLWLNLSDGMILCGRKLWDGSGGNNHAIDHYNETHYPLAVKLGTITSDLEGADVFSYPEDESVTDPLLAEHLAFFGIDFSSLQKTEMTTAEKELDQNTNFDWNRIQESGQEVEPIYGPGYTGLVNLGNSCYLASTMQVVFSTHSFCSRYYKNQNLKMAFDNAPADPTVDLNMQLTKLANGLLSGKYSMPAVQNNDVDSSPNSKQEGIRPRMFKAVIAASHPEFSTMRQQDALEFFLHLIEQVERIHSGNPNLDPSRSFKFGIEERLQCPSGKVAYNKRHDYILSLNIPLDKATNKKELEEFQKFKAQKEAKGEKLSSEEIVRPRVPLSDCLDSFSSPEDVQGFFSTALNTRTTAIKTAGLTSFPDYLVLHMRKFVMEAGWVPKKLDVYIDADDIIDISHMRSKGLQPGEELLPEDGPGGQEESTKVIANEDIVSQLAGMGFNHLHCQKAAINTSNVGVEEAMNWLLSHMDDPDIDAPIQKEAGNNDVDPSKIAMLVSFGFEEEVAKKALKASGGDIEKATDWIFNPPASSGPMDMDATSSSGPTTTTVDPTLPDGNGKYRLIGLVSHIGSNTQCGHYVAHVYKEGRWVIFNDDKVGVSKDPPKDMAYLYFYERIQT